jgi:hypothetical protein
MCRRSLLLRSCGVRESVSGAGRNSRQGDTTKCFQDSVVGSHVLRAKCCRCRFLGLGGICVNGARNRDHDVNPRGTCWGNCENNASDRQGPKPLGNGSAWRGVRTLWRLILKREEKYQTCFTARCRPTSVDYHRLWARW